LDQQPSVFGAASTTTSFDDLSITVVSEPATLALFAFGLAGLRMRRAARA
jgi:hypothetical protein